MDNTFFTCWITAITLFSIGYLLLGNLFHTRLKVEIVAVSVKRAKEALEKMAEWTTWITGIQTAAIASMAFLIDADKKICINALQKQFAFFAILFFGCSIILSAWILSSIPSILQRLPDDEDNVSTTNDIYEFRIFSFTVFKLGPFTGLVHWYFLIGIIFFSLFIFSLIQ